MEASRLREQLNNDKTVMDTNNPTEVEETRAQNAAHEAFLAVDFLAKSDLKRFGSLLAELENSYTRGVDGYPVTLASAEIYPGIAIEPVGGTGLKAMGSDTSRS